MPPPQPKAAAENIPIDHGGSVPKPKSEFPSKPKSAKSKARSKSKAGPKDRAGFAALDAVAPTNAKAAPLENVTPADLEKVDFIAVGRVADQTLLASFSAATNGPADPSSEQLKNAQKVLKAAKKRMTPGQKQKLALGKDQVFAYREPGEGEFVTMCTMKGQRYPERIAFGMHEEFLKLIHENALEEARGAKEFEMNSTLQESMKVLAHKYDDPDSVAKIERLQKKTDKVKDKVTENVSSMLSGMQDVSKLEAEASLLQVEAQE